MRARSVALFLVLLGAWFCDVALAAAPTFQAAGAGVSGRRAITVNWPTHVTGDVALLLVQTANENVTLSTPAGFAQVASSPQGTGVAGGTTATRITVFWARATSNNMASPVVADSGNNQVARIITFRGVIGTGNPWDVTAGGVAATASNTFSIPGATTTVTNDLVVVIVANAVDTTTAQASGWTNANLTGLTERTDFSGSSGNGGGFGAATGVMATPGNYGSTTGSLLNSSVQGLISIALKPSHTILGDGSNPANVTLAPGAAITDLDSFTLQTSDGTDSVTALTVTLTGTNSFQGLSEVRITSSDGLTTYFSAVTNPSSNTVSFSGGTPIPVSSTATTFKVRITPKTHANMPVPPGLSYAVGGTVTAFTSTKEKSGSDGASATVTVDNLSPAGATATSGLAGDRQVVLNWTTSASSDFSRSVMLRWTGITAGADVPAEGTDYVLGNTIGTATVVCVRTADAASTAVSGVDGAGTGGCSATALTNGTAYSYKIFQKDSNGNYDTGVAVGLGTFTPIAPVVVLGGFNAYESATAAAAISGVVKTKVAGSAFNLDLIALNAAKTAIATTFTGAVKVELLDSSGGGTLDANGCNALWPTIQTLAPNPAFVSGNNGRMTLAFTENNAWRNVRVRISYPASGAATVIGCSGDNFAIRPSTFGVSVLDQDWQSAYTSGTGRTLNNTTAAGGTVHAAGQPFTVIATAVNAAATTTTNYSGSPSANVSACVLPAAPTACTAGTVSLGTWATVSGSGVSGVTASYSEVGAFALKLVDSSFASVDASDGSTSAEMNIESASVNVGRFVPDHFDLSTNTPKLKTFNDSACATRSFTYIGQPFGYVTAPQVTITAKSAGASGTTTVNYQGTLWKLAAAGVTQTYNYTLAPVSTPGLTSVIGTPTVVPTSNGTGTATASATDLLTFTRVAATPQAPFTAAITLTMNVADSSEAAVAGNGTINATAAAVFDDGGSGNGIAFDAGNAFRFGRVRLANANGSELLDLPMTMRSEYWLNATSGWQVNSADSCTNATLAFAAVGTDITAQTCVWDTGPAPGNSGKACTTPIAVASRQYRENGVAGFAGDFNVWLKAPGAGFAGAIDVTATLPAWLQYNWTGVAGNPTARATFGVRSSGPVIYRMERY